jgi:hypothetical protein
MAGFSILERLTQPASAGRLAPPITVENHVARTDHASFPLLNSLINDTDNRMFFLSSMQPMTPLFSRRRLSDSEPRLKTPR